MSDKLRAALHPVEPADWADECRIVDLDGQAIRVRGRGTGSLDEATLAVLRAARDEATERAQSKLDAGVVQTGVVRMSRLHGNGPTHQLLDLGDVAVCGVTLRTPGRWWGLEPTCPDCVRLRP